MKVINMIFFLLLLPNILFPGRVVPLPGILKPQRIYVDREQIFITEGASIYMYSLADFKLQKKFGKRGEGPGEFKEMGEGLTLEFSPENVIVVSSGRMSYFTRDGRFIKENRVADPRRSEFKELAGGFVGQETKLEDNSVFISVNFFDRNLKKVKEIYRYKHPFYPRQKPINAVFLRTSTYYVHRGKIFYDDEEGTIHVLDDQGRELHSIPSRYEGPKVKQVHKQRYLEIWRIDLKEEYNAFKNRLKFPGRFPPVRNYHVIDDKIYVITFIEDNNRSKVLVYDLAGKMLEEVWVPLVDINMLLPYFNQYYTIYRDNAYILRENPETGDEFAHPPHGKVKRR